MENMRMKNKISLMFAVLLAGEASAAMPCIEWEVDGGGMSYCTKCNQTQLSIQPDKSSKPMLRLMNDASYIMFPISDMYLAIKDHNTRIQNLGNIWSKYNYLRAATQSLECVLDSEDCIKSMKGDFNEFINHAAHANITGLVRHSHKVTSTTRDATAAWLSIAAKVTDVGTRAGTVIEFSTRIIYPVTDIVGSAKVLSDMFNNRTAIPESINKCNSVPKTIEDSMDSVSGRLYWLSFIRTVTGAIAYVGGKFGPVIEYVGDEALAAGRSYFGSVATASKTMYDQAFSWALTLPMVNGMSRWAMAKYTEDDSTAIVAAQVVTTTIGWYCGFSQLLLVVDAGFNVAINHEAYWNGTKNIVHGTVNVAYEVKDGLWNVASNVYSIMGASNSSEEL